jgi:SHS2 domain-containing protein
MDAKRPFSGFKEVPHKADIALDVFAPNLSEMFINAAMGLYHILGIRKGTVDLDKIDIMLDEIDLESLLVSFLNELLYYVDMGMAAEQIEVRICGNQLAAALQMVGLDACQRAIKAVTYNELKISKSERGFQTRIVIDI